MIGNIYFIRYPVTGWVKIGYATEVKKRFIGLQVSCPEKLVLEAQIPGTHAQEQALHRVITGPRRGEWFAGYWIADELVQKAKDGVDADSLIAFAKERCESIENNIAKSKRTALLAGWAKIANDPLAKDHMRAMCRAKLIEEGADNLLTAEAKAYDPDLSWIDHIPPKARRATRKIYGVAA